MTLDSKRDLRFALWSVELLKGKAFQDELGYRTLSLTVSMYEHGQANDFEMTVENRDRYFSDPSKIQLGDEVKFYVWFADKTPVGLVTFTIDEIEDSAPPSIVRLSGLSSDTVSKELRTLKSRGFEGTSLHKIVEDIAREHGFTPIIEGKDVRLERKEQKEEHDLRFLTRLAEEYGYNFRIDGTKLYFIAMEVDEAKPALSIKGLLKSRTFRYKTFKTFQKSIVRYYDPKTKEFIEVEELDPKIDTSNLIKMTIRAESREQAERIAKSSLRRKNRRQIEGEFECMGVPELQAGINILVEGEGEMFDGTWHIEEAHHEYSKDTGYTVRLRGYKL